MEGAHQALRCQALGREQRLYFQLFHDGILPNEPNARRHSHEGVIQNSLRPDQTLSSEITLILEFQLTLLFLREVLALAELEQINLAITFYRWCWHLPAWHDKQKYIVLVETLTFAQKLKHVEPLM